MFSRYLTYALLGAMAALPIGCLVGGVLFGVAAYFMSSEAVGFWSNISFGLFFGMVAMLIGIVPTLVYGVPAYAYVAFRWHPNLLAALLLGSFPGALMFVMSMEWANFFLLFGVLVAGCLHAIAGPRLSSLAE